MTTVRVLILDFDGVVVESNDIKTEAFHCLFKSFPEYTNTMMAFHHENVSLTRFAKFDHLLELMGKADNQELKDKIAADFSRKVLEGMMKVPLVIGAISFLQNVTSRIPVYLASVTPEKELLIILKDRKLLPWFRAVYGCPPWSKPDAIQDVLLKERLRPEHALLIGDSAGDQRAANSTGVNFLGRDSGLCFDDPQPQCFADLNEINNYLNEQIL